MTFHKRILSKINQIRNQAKKQRGNIQKLMKNLELNIGLLSKDGYSMTLLEATEDTNIQLHNGFTDMTGNDNKPWIKLVNKHDLIDFAKYDTDAKEELKAWNHSIPKYDYFAVCKVSLDKKQSNQHRRFFNYEFRQLTYLDIIGIVKRFYAIKMILEQYDGMGYELDTNSIFEIIKYAKRLAQKDKIASSVNLLLSTKIADEAHDIIVDVLTKQHSVKIVNHHNNVEICNLNTDKETKLTKHELIVDINVILKSMNNIFK